MKNLSLHLLVNREIANTYILDIYLQIIDQMTLFYNAKIYTPDGIKSWMWVDDNLIKDIGITDPPDISDSIDMNGKIILPGLIDAHLHVFGLGRHLEVLRLKGSGSISEIQNKLSEYTTNNEWIEGRGWDQGIFEDKRYLHRDDLDKIVSDKPVILFRTCHHIAVVNSKALEIAGIDNSTADPDGGEIERDNKGVPTGILKENALRLITPFIKQSRQSKKKMILAGINECLRMGLTSVQPNDGGTWNIYRELQEEGKLPIRVSLTLNHDELSREGTPTPGSRIDKLHFDRVKLFADGSLGAQTAAMREPYTDTGELGMPIYSQDEMNNLVAEAKRAGARLEIHAIGDLAAEIMINAIEYNNITDRPILTHAQILGKDLIERMSKLGIIANIQPPFIITDGVWIDKRIGLSERRKYSYAWKTLLDAGIHVSGGSDAPIESSNPLLGIYSAIFREDVIGNMWREEEKLSFDEALRIYTEGGAYAMKEEHRLGRLEKGYLADFIVLTDDVISDPSLLKCAKIDKVFVSGKCEFTS